MKRLLLMRHAKSSWKDSNLPDRERPLKKKGERDAERMGKMLKDKNLVPDLILTSTAVRAVETAKLLTAACKCGAERIQALDSLYMAEPTDILEAIRTYGNGYKTVMVIGHNPGMEAFLQIINGAVESLPTASIAYVGARLEDWSELGKHQDGQVKLKKLWRPKDLG